MSRAYSCRATTEGRAVGMVYGCPLTRASLAVSVQIDLPVDAIVVLEQQKRTGQGERVARSARERI